MNPPCRKCNRLGRCVFCLVNPDFEFEAYPQCLRCGDVDRPDHRCLRPSTKKEP